MSGNSRSRQQNMISATGLMCFCTASLLRLLESFSDQDASHAGAAPFYLFVFLEQLCKVTAVTAMILGCI